MSAVVAIVGRPNVGKSTLFNRLIGRRESIESDVPGTTRDRLYQMTKVSEYSVLLVDTGGLELGRTGNDLEANVQEQSKVAIDGADAILFVVDVRTELTAEDFHAATLLRKSKKPVILVANKCDNATFEEQRFNLFELGFGEPLAVSALHADGLDGIRRELTRMFEKLKIEKKSDSEMVKDEGIAIAFLGRPNVGKSTMINSLFGKKAVITSDIPGTTRDSTKIPFQYHDQDFVLIDTAGLRRRGKIEKGIEHYSILRTMQAVEEADICVLLLDFEEGITNQDCHVSEVILNEKKGLILVVNKMDLAAGPEREQLENEYIYQLRKKMAYLPWAPVVFSSALDRKNIFSILDLAINIDAQRKKRVPQEDLNVWLDMTLSKHPPKGKKGQRRFNILRMEQTDVEPPSFDFYCDWPELCHFSYRRYLENAIRLQFGYNGCSIVLRFRPSNARS